VEGGGCRNGRCVDVAHLVLAVFRQMATCLTKQPHGSAFHELPSSSAVVEQGRERRRSAAVGREREERRGYEGMEAGRELREYQGCNVLGEEYGTHVAVPVPWLRG